MTIKAPFGAAMRQTHFSFSPNFTPLNHGSYGTHPIPVNKRQVELNTLSMERPDPWIIYTLPGLIDESRERLAPMLGVHVDEVVFVQNATTGVNTVLRNLKWEKGDVVIHFSTIYSACEKTLSSIKEIQPLEAVSIPLEYPIEDVVIVERLRETIEKVRKERKRVRLAMFDTVLTFPGARMPWEQLVAMCKEMEVLSLIDGAHGIGHIDLRHLGNVGPDFFVSNCHKWLYNPRGCAVFYVPLRNQHLIRTSFPTSHGYQYLDSAPEQTDKSPFVHLFEFVATIDYTPYACIPAALDFREHICGGEEAIRKYNFDIAREGGKKVAEALDTWVMDNETKTMSQCCFANVALPLSFGENGAIDREKKFAIEDAGKIGKWLNITAVKECDTYLQMAFHAGVLWVRLSGQIYLEMKDFEWVGGRLKELCVRVERGEAS